MRFIKLHSRVNGSILLILLSLFCSLFCSACGQSAAEVKVQVAPEASVVPGSNEGAQQGALDQNLAVPNNQQTDYFRIILYGNSHVAGLSSLIQQLISAGVPQALVEVTSFGGGFLDESYLNGAAQLRLSTTPWTHAIFQGQKYSQSGTTFYPTIDTEKWLDKAKSLGITPILFPEHAQRGRLSEGEYVYQLHQGIANRQSTCLAPIPVVWQRVLQLSPQIELHAQDGNHASYIGRLLTALVFYEVITGRSADLLPYQANLAISEQTQSLFGQVVSEVLEDKPACLAF
jgi:hypothetical protein